MSAPAAAIQADVRTKKLHRWSIGLFAVAVVLAVATAQVLDAAPFVVSAGLGQAMGGALVIAVLSYLFVRGERSYRNARVAWIFGWVVALAAIPAVIVEHRMEERREAEKLLEVVKSMGLAIKRSDEEMSERIQKAVSDTTRAVLSSVAIADAAARKSARAELAAAVKAIDESFAQRARSLEDTVKKVEASGASKRLKRVTIHELRADRKEPLAVQMTRGVRVFLLKADELIALVDANAAGVEVSDGALAFADTAVLERYKTLQAEMAASQQAMRELAQQAGKSK
jgi:hypothetical protein